MWKNRQIVGREFKKVSGSIVKAKVLRSGNRANVKCVKESTSVARETSTLCACQTYKVRTKLERMCGRNELRASAMILRP